MFRTTTIVTLAGVYGLNIKEQPRPEEHDECDDMDESQRVTYDQWFDLFGVSFEADIKQGELGSMSDPNSLTSRTCRSIEEGWVHRRGIMCSDCHIYF